jgi:hypothetical protein
MISSDATLPPRPARRSRAVAPAARALSPRVDEAIQVVLTMLREQIGMDVVFVRQYTEGERRFRMVEALSHGRAAALATGQASGGEAGVLLDAPIVLPGGRVHGSLCCFSPGEDAATHARDLRSLRHGARLASRLLDNEQVLRELSRQTAEALQSTVQAAAAADAPPARPARNP